MSFFSLKRVLFLMLCLGITLPGISQISTDELGGPVFTSMPFLRITPDTRAGGMGDLGLATSPDAASIYWNSAKLAFAESDMSAQVNYTPWLRNLVDDIFMAYLSGYKKVDSDQAIGLSMRYFSLGEIQFTDINAREGRKYNPYELAIDLAYARKLSDKLSLGLNLKYAHSNLGAGEDVEGQTLKAANAVAADLSMFYTKEMVVGNSLSELSIGAAITNIGNKVSYSEDNARRDFIPTNLGLGLTYTAHIDDYNKIMIGAEVNKLMAPTPDLEATFSDKPLLTGIFGSFSDAPGGFSEEMKELMYSVGLEYWYNNQFAVRAGHFNEHSTKGNRKYVSLGLGLKYNVFGLDFSYLIPTIDTGNHPLQNTLRFGLSFDLDS